MTLLYLGLLGCVPKDEADDSADDTTYETYTCGWEKRDPGTLVSTGVEEGDVLADLGFVDQCGETFRIWDMYSKYFLLFYTAAW